jgi:hypothetical protein
VEEPGEDEAEQAQGRLEELRVQLESKRPARYVENSECSKCQRRQKQRKTAVGTKKLTSFFVPVANGDNNNEDNKQQDTDDDSSEDEEEAPYKSLWPNMGRPSQIWTKVINFDRQYLCQKKRF